MSDVEAVVRRYFSIVADLESSQEALLEVLHPDVRVVEHPNAISPSGTVRDHDGVVAGFIAGKQLLARQEISILELVVSGERAAVRAEWRGQIGEGAGGGMAGASLVAHIAAWLTVRDGLVLEHETFDCYEPLPF